jgi:hypothetical protein
MRPAVRTMGLFYQPSYSAELNPKMMANVDLKNAVTTLASARTKLLLAKATSKHLCRVYSASPTRSRATSSVHSFDMPPDFISLVPGQQ